MQQSIIVLSVLRFSERSLVQLLTINDVTDTRLFKIAKILFYNNAENRCQLKLSFQAITSRIERVLNRNPTKVIYGSFIFREKENCHCYGYCCRYSECAFSIFILIKQFKSNYIIRFKADEVVRLILLKKLAKIMGTAKHFYTYMYTQIGRYKNIYALLPFEINGASVLNAFPR